LSFFFATARRSLSSPAVPATLLHLRPTAALAERALLPDDPGHALALAQALLDGVLMFNHSRGLWGYTGTAADGEPLTIQSTGLGGPSTAVVLEELCDLGLRTAIGVGPCEALRADLALGDLVVASAAVTGDGASAALAGASSVRADAELATALAERAEHAGLVASHDLHYAPPPAPAGALATNLQAATILAVAQRRGVRAACVLTVAATPTARLDAERLEAAIDRAGRAGATALAPRTSRT
jgi:uridine phosphorylase